METFEVKLDFVGIYLSTRNKDNSEILMADELRYKNTTTRASITLLRNGDVLVDFSNVFKERPYEVCRSYFRIDIYIELEELYKLLKKFKNKVLRNRSYDEVLKRAPNPSHYQYGDVPIPLVEIMPSYRLDVKNVSLKTPKWCVFPHNTTVFIDIEEDKRRRVNGTLKGIQFHIGIKLMEEHCKYMNENIAVGEMVKVDGKFIIPGDLIYAIHSYVEDAYRKTRNQLLGRVE